MKIKRGATVTLLLQDVLDEVDIKDVVAHYGTELLDHFSAEDMLENIDEDAIISYCRENHIVIGGVGNELA